MDATGSSPQGQHGVLAIRRAADQFVTERDGITTRHCFSFADHYDPDRVRLGPLVALNDEQLPPGTGYAAHHHRDLDIVTWVLEGRLRHGDSTGHAETVRPGTVQHLSAGSGVDHSETNAGGPGQSLRFLQLWFALEEDVDPSYETWTLEDEDDWLGWTLIAGRQTPRRSTILAVPGVDVWVGHLPSGTTGTLIGAGRATVETFTYVASGLLATQDHGGLHPGDTVRTTSAGIGVQALDDSVLLAVELSRAVWGR